MTDIRLTPEEPYLLGTDPEEGRRLAASPVVAGGPRVAPLHRDAGPRIAAPRALAARGAGGAGRVAAARTRIPGRRLRALAVLLSPGPGAGHRAGGIRLRPGGRFVVWDYLNYRATTLCPPGPAFDRVPAAVSESWRRTGGDLNVGARLPGLLAGAGCRILDLVPIVRLARPGTELWEWPTGFFYGYVPRLVEAGLLTEAERRAFEAEWQEREQDPGAFLSPPSMLGIIAEKR